MAIRSIVSSVLLSDVSTSGQNQTALHFRPGRAVGALLHMLIGAAVPLGVAIKTRKRYNRG